MFVGDPIYPSEDKTSETLANEVSILLPLHPLTSKLLHQQEMTKDLKYSFMHWCNKSILFNIAYRLHLSHWIRMNLMAFIQSLVIYMYVCWSFTNMCTVDSLLAIRLKCNIHQKQRVHHIGLKESKLWKQNVFCDNE